MGYNPRALPFQICDPMIVKLESLHLLVLRPSRSPKYMKLKMKNKSKSQQASISSSEIEDFATKIRAIEGVHGCEDEVITRFCRKERDRGGVEERLKASWRMKITRR